VPPEEGVADAVSAPAAVGGSLSSPLPQLGPLLPCLLVAEIILSAANIFRLGQIYIKHG
jgi:hypothetical protein